MFVMIGACHPLVVWLEYSVGRRVWWVLVLLGLVFFALSLFFSGVFSLLLGGAGASMLYSALEVRRQHVRVCLGRAVRNPNRPDAYYRLPVGSSNRGEVNEL